jgi:hypothetical protein
MELSMAILILKRGRIKFYPFYHSAKAPFTLLQVPVSSEMAKSEFIRRKTKLNTVKPLFIVFVGGSQKETMDPGKQ